MYRRQKLEDGSNQSKVSDHQYDVLVVYDDIKADQTINME